VVVAAPAPAVAGLAPAPVNDLVVAAAAADGRGSLFFVFVCMFQMNVFSINSLPLPLV
jgi:hypothetical protein